MAEAQLPTSGSEPRPSRFALFKEHVYLSRFAFTMFVPLVSAASVIPAKLPGFPTLLVIVLVAWGFHMTFYGFNDVTDYELDKVLGKKDDHPLVRGDMSRRTALAIAVAHTVGAFIVELLSGTTFQLMLLLAIACGGVIIYDVFSKRNPFPPLTDAIEGIGFIALALYGAAKVGTPTILSYMLALNFGIFINFITGSFLGIVDIKGDFPSGARTTPIWFGTRPVEGSASAYIPRGLTIFGTLQIFALLFVNLLPILRNDFKYPPITWAVIMTIVIILSIAVCIHTIPFIVSRVKWQKRPVETDLDLLAVFSVLILGVSYLPYLATSWLIFLAVCVITPLAAAKILARL